LPLQPCHLHSSDGTTTGWFLQGPQGVSNRPGTGQLIHRQKFTHSTCPTTAKRRGGRAEAEDNGSPRRLPCDVAAGLRSSPNGFVLVIAFALVS
jgi:sulfur relay (sulfurtransferase) complex TusBCD TusD component (DsrE family)